MIRNMVKKLAVFICIFLLGRGMQARAESFPQSPPGFYDDGDIIGFIGDSITYVSYAPVSYMDLINQYYLSVFPDRDMEFRNLSADGYKLIDVLNIYDQDPAFRGISKAVIMLGTNEAILGVSAEEYIGNMSALIGRLKEDGLEGSDILILSPPVCDENCSMNFTKNGSRKWVFESRVLEYMSQLEQNVGEWGVRYLDLHTPMAALTEIIQQEDPGNSLTRDCIHPTATGQWLIACLILQAQGADPETLSEIRVPADREPETVGNDLADFYRSEKGICMTLTPRVLPMPDSEGLTAFRDFIEHYASCGSLFRQAFSIQGLSEDAAYRLWADDVELGAFTGKELAEGIDMGNLEAYPQQQAVQQAENLVRQRHEELGTGRDMWIEVMMQRVSYTPEQIQETYGAWHAADEALCNEIYETVRKTAGGTFRIAVTADGYSPEELEQDAAEARKAAAEQAAREAEEAAKKAAEELAAREAEEAAKKAAEELAVREAEAAAARQVEDATQTSVEQQAQNEAGKAAKEKEAWGGLAGGAVLLMGIGIFFLVVKRKKSR